MLSGETELELAVTGRSRASRSSCQGAELAGAVAEELSKQEQLLGGFALLLSGGVGLPSPVQRLG